MGARRCRGGSPEPLLPGRCVYPRLLDTEGSDEDVHHYNDEHQARGQVVEEIQLGVLGRVVEVLPDWGEWTLRGAAGGLSASPREGRTCINTRGQWAHLAA